VLIADVGINHNGDLQIAKQLISVCHSAGIEYVKFQKRNPDMCVPESQKAKMRETPWGDMTYLEYRWKVEFGLEEYLEIDKFCKYIGQKWFMSVWDLDSLNFAAYFDADYIKIPSAKITDMELLKQVRIIGRPVILSTGGCTQDMIDDAMRVVGDALYGIMHCTSTYPCRADEINLNCIQTFRKLYPGVKIGFSNHHPGTVAVTLAIGMGCDMVEFHVTLDRAMWGTDHAASFEPEGIFKVAKYAKNIGQMLGDGIKKFYPSELPVMEKLRT